MPQLSAREYLALILDSSATLLQWRENDLSEEETDRLFASIGTQRLRRPGRLFFVNHSLELALRWADGVHLKSSQPVPSPEELRSRGASRDFLIGKSVHSLKEAQAAEEEGIDYLLLAPIHSPLSKKSQGTPLGLGYLREVCSTVGLPVFALGGVTLDDQDRIRTAGAAGLAGITWLHEELDQTSRCSS